MDARFTRDPQTLDEIRAYYRERVRQSLWEGARFAAPLEETPWGAVAHLEVDGATYRSPFILPPYRKQGIVTRLLAETEQPPLVTSPHCTAMDDRLRGQPRVRRLFGAPLYPEYARAQQRLGSRRAKRSQAWYMAHIDEGLFILTQLGASHEAKQAYILHPLVQDDEELSRSISEGLHRQVDPFVWTLALEYRQFANRHLSRHKVSDPSEIGLSPLPEVGDMLRADKIQNRKDFEQYHAGHPNRERLQSYFAEWFARLEISEETYVTLTAPLLAVDQWK